MRALILGLSLVASCGSGSTDTDETGLQADVTAVTVSGDEGQYTFAVAVSSPDTGCEQYADWWEVVTPEGELVFRRILTHSHVDEQPFTRTGGPVPTGAEDEVIVRAHLAPGGFGGAAMRGSPTQGFQAFTPESGFAEDLDTAPPLPTGCAF